jgi:hypothetical protein
MLQSVSAASATTEIIDHLAPDVRKLRPRPTSGVSLLLESAVKGSDYYVELVMLSHGRMVVHGEFPALVPAVYTVPTDRPDHGMPMHLCAAAAFDLSALGWEHLPRSMVEFPSPHVYDARVALHQLQCHQLEEPTATLMHEACMHSEAACVRAAMRHGLLAEIDGMRPSAALIAHVLILRHVAATAQQNAKVRDTKPANVISIHQKR